jgi:hypothetical protein
MRGWLAQGQALSSTAKRSRIGQLTGLQIELSQILIGTAMLRVYPQCDAAIFEGFGRITKFSVTIAKQLLSLVTRAIKDI